MKNIKKIILITSFMVLAAGSTFAKPKKKVLRIATANSLTLRESGTVAVAKAEKFFEKELEKLNWDIDYSVTKGGVVLNEGLYAKEFDIGIIGDVPGITGLYNEIGVVWIGSALANSDQVIAVKKGSNIKKPEDLYGKTLALFIGTAPHITWANYAKYYNLDTSKINIVNLNGADSLVALEAGKVDAGIQTAASLLKMKKDGSVDVLFNTVTNPEWGGQSVIVVRKEFAKKNPDVVVAFIKALFRARQVVQKDPDKYYDYLSGSQIKGDVELGREIFNIDNGKFDNLDPGLTELSLKKAQNLIDVFVEIERFPKRKDIKDFVDLTYYQKAVKQLKDENFEF